MAKFCLTKETVLNFKKALQSGEINPDVMANMESKERKTFLEKYVGKENGKEVNALFESKLLLKNKKAGYITWAKKVSGISKEAKRDIISKIERMQNVLDPKEEEQFLNDLVEKRLGVSITEEQAKMVSKLSKRVAELQKTTDKTKPDVRLGRAMIDITDYINSFKTNKNFTVTDVINIPRGVMTSIDLSAMLNQGWGYMSRKSFYKAIIPMLKAGKSEEGYKNLHAEIITHPDYNKAKKAGLRLTDLGADLNKREEGIMSRLLDKVPGISHSQRAYTGFLNKLRIEAFSDLLYKAEMAGENIEENSENIKELAKVVNDFTGGARVGEIEGAVPFLSATIFSPRKVKSVFNMLNPIKYVDPRVSKTARIERTRNAMGSILMTITMISLYSLLTGEEQEKDSRGTDFGKIKIGNTRVDLTGGIGTYVTLISRIATQQKKTQTGKIVDLGTGYNEISSYDLLTQSLRYKLSPFVSLLVDISSGENAVGQKKTPTQSVIDRFKPLYLNSLVEMVQDEKLENKHKVIFGLLGLVGAGLNTYSFEENWEEKKSKEMIQFKKQVGGEQFKKANEDYNRVYDWWYDDVTSKEEFKNLTEEQKEKLIKDAKQDIKERIFKENNFKYKKDKKEEKQNEVDRKKIKKLLPFN